MEDYKSAHILIVDDEEEIRELLSEQLEHSGFTNISIAADGLEALESLERGNVQLVLADLLMPRMNGMELYNEMNKRNLSPRFVLVTGSDLEDVSPRPSRKIELIQKPFDYDVFLEQVSQMCQEL